MVIDLRRCAEATVHVERAFDVAEYFVSDPEVETVDAVKVVLGIAEAGARRFIASGRLETEVTACCVRCLSTFTIALARSFRVTYLPEMMRPPAGSGESRLDTSTIDVSYYKDDKLDVLPLLAEQVNLGFPMRFVCREECRGLCSQCGVNLNQTECSCQPPPKASAFELLKDILN